MHRVIRLILATALVAAIAVPVAAQQAQTQTAPNPLVQLLQSKGILTAEEAATVRSASNSGEANERLAHLLLSKGLISQEEYNSTAAASSSAVSAATNTTGGAHMMNAAVTAAPAPTAIAAATAQPAKSAEWPVSPAMVGYDPSDGTAADATVIPAIAPIRVLPIGLPRDPKGIIPDIKLGSGAMLNIYGFLKASAIYDTTNSGGSVVGSNDFPLPLLLNTGNGDTGPDKGSQFRIKARSARAGVNFFWPLNGPNLTLTGKMEFDWEGDFTTVSNRNVSSIRNSQLTMRLAWARVDGKFGDTPWFVLFGQDWTPVASSTMFDVFETTQLAAYFGNTYERMPQFRTGLQFSAGKLKVQPEFAIVLSAFGDSGLNTSTTNALFGSLGQIPTGFQDQTRAGAVLGQASGQPGVAGRLVFDFPLNSGWKGVPNAEIVFSGGHSEAEYIVPVGNIPTTAVAALQAPTNAQPFGLAANSCATATAAGFSVRCYYPTGLTMNVPNNVFTAEAQLPTPWFTVVGKYYRGGDLRFMFGGLLNSAFRDTHVGAGGAAVAPFVIPGGFSSVLCTVGSVGCSAAGTANLTLNQTVLALSGDTATFSNVGGAAVVDPYRPIRGQGGFLQVGIPLSRIFGANPEGLNSGWTLFAGYGVDSAFARDVIRSGGNGLQRADYAPISLRYKVNRWMQIVNEVTWYDTRTADKTLVLFRGVNAHVNHDIRNEFGTIFTF
jgi:hypothetical protein